MATKNAAYDLAMFEQRNPTTRKTPAPNRRRPEKVSQTAQDKARRRAKRREIEKRRAQMAFRARIAGIAMMFLSLVSVTIYSKVILAETVTEISSGRNQLQQLKSEGTRLYNEVERKSSDSGIEEIARNELGLVPIESYQKYYIPETAGDRVDILTGNDKVSLIERIKMFFSGNTNTDSEE